MSAFFLLFRSFILHERHISFAFFICSVKLIFRPLLFEILFVYLKNYRFSKVSSKNRSFKIRNKTWNLFYKTLFDNLFVQKKNNRFFQVRSNDFKSMPISTVYILTCKDLMQGKLF